MSAPEAKYIPSTTLVMETFAVAGIRKRGNWKNEDYAEFSDAKDKFMDWLIDHDATVFTQAKAEALAPVLALHQPSQIWEYDDMNGVFKLDADGEQIPMHKLCIECTSEDVLEAVGDCEYSEGSLSGEVRWPCATYTAATLAPELTP